MSLLHIIQIVIATALIVAILLQNQGAGLSGVFGGSGNVFATKRGLEKKLFYATIILSVLFFAVSLYNVIS
jgi:preprotein translocase subunit SecG